MNQDAPWKGRKQLLVDVGDKNVSDYTFDKVTKRKDLWNMYWNNWSAEAINVSSF